MTIANNSAHRARWLQNVLHIQAHIGDLMNEIDIAIPGAFVAREVEELILEADVHCALAIKELDTAAARIRGIV